MHFIDGVELADLCSFWTGSNMLPVRSQMLHVSFDSDGDMELPMAESCFFSIVLPVKHATFDAFSRCLDIALGFGSSGFCFT